uniref:Core-binding (CB) domain-containing protein n=1 Tax=Sphenodon punctatus TaxID=8508 RepID=A0A8D0L1J2_SPHPU
MSYHQETGLASIPRPQGRLPPHSDLGTPSTMAPIHLPEHTLPVQGPTIRPLVCATNIHESTDPTGGEPPQAGDSHISVPRRPPTTSTECHQTSDGYQPHHTVPSETRLHGESGQKPPDTNAPDRASGGIHRYHLRSRFHPNRTTGQDPTENPTSKGPEASETKKPSSTVGPPSVLHKTGSVGKIPPSPLAAAAATFSARSYQRKKSVGQDSTRPTTLNVLVVRPRRLPDGRPPRGTGKGRSDDGRKFEGLGSPHGVDGGPGPVVTTTISDEHQHSRTYSNPPGPTTPSPRHRQNARPGVYGQRDSESVCESPGGLEIPASTSGSHTIVHLGGNQSEIPKGTSYQGDTERSSGLVEPSIDRPTRMESPSGDISLSDKDIRLPGDRPVRNEREPEDIPVHDKDKRHSLRSSRRPKSTLATRSAVRLSTDSSLDQSSSTDHHTSSSRDPCNPLVAKEAVVFRLSRTEPRSSNHPSITTGLAVAGPSSMRFDRDAKVNSMALEGSALRGAGYSEAVLKTLQQARRPATRKSYAATWKVFALWAMDRGLDPCLARVQTILQFLQEGLEKGLRPNTLARQASAISSVLQSISGRRFLPHKHINQFLRAARNISPPVVHRCPSWSLSLVLDALTGPPFEPLKHVSLYMLSLKVVFLVAVTSARRVSELGALSMEENFCLFSEQSVTLRMDEAFIPKVNSTFHRAQEVILPSFCPKPSHPKEKVWHTLDVRRALKIYLRRTSSIRTTS